MVIQCNACTAADDRGVNWRITHVHVPSPSLTHLRCPGFICGGARGGERSRPEQPPSIRGCASELELPLAGVKQVSPADLDRLEQVGRLAGADRCQWPSGVAVPSVTSRVVTDIYCRFSEKWPVRSLRASRRSLRTTCLRRSSRRSGKCCTEKNSGELPLSPPPLCFSADV